MSLNTLEFTSDAGVRAVLVALCADPTIKKRVLRLIDKPEPHAANLAANYATRHGAPLKRKATGQAICIQCEEVFDEGENHLKKCCYHFGEMEPDDEYWDDYNDEFEITVEEHAEGHPEGFIW